MIGNCRKGFLKIMLSGSKGLLILMKISQKLYRRNWLRTFFEVDDQDPEKLHELHNDLTFLPERMKIVKFVKLVAN